MSHSQGAQASSTACLCELRVTLGAHPSLYSITPWLCLVAWLAEVAHFHKGRPSPSC